MNKRNLLGLASMALMFASLDPMITPRHKRVRHVQKPWEDKVIETLVRDGVCSIDNNMFLNLYNTLQNKLRGQVLFHCDIKTKSIFITYTKYSSNNLINNKQ